MASPEPEDSVPLSPSGARSTDGDVDLEAGVRPTTVPLRGRRRRHEELVGGGAAPPPRRGQRRQIHVLKLWLYALALVLFFGGWLAWKNDLNGAWCFRRGSALYWLQGHAVWHVLTMGALGCIYWFFRSERLVD